MEYAKAASGETLAAITLQNTVAIRDFDAGPARPPQGVGKAAMPRTVSYAAIAAMMVDEELPSIVHKITDEDDLTPLQSAVMGEWLQRQPRPTTN